MNMSSVYGFIANYVFIFVLVLWFVIVLTLILWFFLVDPNDTIFNKYFFKAHTLFLDVFLCLETIHDHVMCKTRMGIFYEHFNKVMLWDSARNSCCEDLPSLQAI